MGNNSATKEVLCRKEAAEYLSISTTMLDNLNLPRSKNRGGKNAKVFYRKADLDSYLEANMVGKEEPPAEPRGQSRYGKAMWEKINRLLLDLDEPPSLIERIVYDLESDRGISDEDFKALVAEAGLPESMRGFSLDFEKGLVFDAAGAEVPYESFEPVLLPLVDHLSYYIYGEAA